MKFKVATYFLVIFVLACRPTRDSKAFDYDISYTYQGKDIVFHINNKNLRKIPWRHISDIGVSLIKENDEHEVVWFMQNVGCDDLNTDLKFGSTPNGYLVQKNKKLEVGGKYLFYFIPISGSREFRLEFVYNPPRHENISK